MAGSRPGLQIAIKMAGAAAGKWQRISSKSQCRRCSVPRNDKTLKLNHIVVNRSAW